MFHLAEGSIARDMEMHGAPRARTADGLTRTTTQKPRMPRINTIPLRNYREVSSLPILRDSEKNKPIKETRPKLRDLQAREARRSVSAAQLHRRKSSKNLLRPTADIRKGPE